MINLLMNALQAMRAAIVLLLALALLTGVLYPALVTAIAQTCFNWRANGSLIEVDGRVVGSALIGQNFNEAEYFWGRPSATAEFPYNALASGGSNYSVNNPKFLAEVRERITAVKQGADVERLVPVDLVTSSASGLDPDISLQAAHYQVARVAAARHLEVEELIALIKTIQTARTFNILGEPTVNVLRLNLALDKLRSAHGRASSGS